MKTIYIQANDMLNYNIYTMKTIYTGEIEAYLEKENYIHRPKVYLLFCSSSHWSLERVSAEGQ